MHIVSKSLKLTKRVGRRSLALTPEQIRRLQEIRIARRLSIPQFKLFMAAPFTWQSLDRALKGKPIWELNHAFVCDWLRRWALEQAPKVIDGKSAASGERSEETGEAIHRD